MRKLILVIALLLAPIAAQASQMYAVFHGGSHTNVDACYGNPANAINGDVWIPFTPSSNDQIIQHYDYSGSSLVYSYAPPPTPIFRDIRGFVMAIRTDPTFNAQVRNELGKLMGLMGADYQTPQLAQQDWSDAVANPTNSTWLTTSVQNTVVQYATTYKIPITTSIP